MFLTLMIAGLVGLLVMALPAFGRHGHAAGRSGARAALRAGGARGTPAGGARGTLAAGAGRLAPGQGHAHAAAVHAHKAHAPAAHAGVTRFIPDPRTIFSVLSLYGAFANALVDAAHLGPLAAGLVAVAPALLVERLVVQPVWNLLFRFEGRTSSPLEGLVLAEARATTPFRNGKGLVSVERDGRLVQFQARLTPGHENAAVRVGDALTIEDIDAPRERVTVSLAGRTLITDPKDKGRSS